MANRILINEQETTTYVGTDPNLKKAWAAGCFTGRGYQNTEYKYNGKLALWKQKDGDWQFVTSPEPAKLEVFITEPKVDGRLLNQGTATCANMTRSIYSEPEYLTPAQEETLQMLLKKGFLKSNDPRKDPDKYTFTDINSKRDEALAILGSEALLNFLTNKQTFNMWIPKKVTAPVEKSFVEKGQEVDTNAQAKELVTYLTSETQGWKTNVSPNQIDSYVKCDLANVSYRETQYGKNCYTYASISKYKSYAPNFGNGYTLYMPISTEVKTSDTTQGYSDEYQFACSAAKTNNFDKNSCSDCILKYYNATKVSAANSSPDPGYPELVDMCLKRNNDDFPKYRKFVIPYLRGEGLTSQRSNWGINRTSYKEKKGFLGLGQVREEKILKRTISESLQSVKRKKEQLLTESKIVKKRFKIILENRNLRNKKSLDIFFDRFLTETAYFNHHGYNQELIFENLIDTVGSFLSGTGLDAALGSLKEYAASWVLGKFGVDKDSWLGAIIITTIGNIPIGDITKLTDCNYIVPLLAKSIPESMAKKFLASKGMDNALSSVVRNATVEIIDDNSFVQSLEKGLSKAICPIWSGLVGKISGALGGLGGSAASAVTGLGGGASSLLGGLFGGSKSSGDKNSNPTTTNDN